ncbi:uncharacterized protein PHACADRAFT_248276 [Phanerochaete carnosa HHB-10118-sp]|uniref:Uncharacterized protein n=1 Tax=Phanerochaete carnosa (strain HHB-10118-sp) TaxID=650164 RepID=K5XES6_PHACS|nr:uncharacterized protein PHACADRAFT_248276 [Phanerochaete carnosa HHB-10118-sp]EKM61587.1 hypothetical protein PHACADRAFT_248276 [Phanerochaete carnosa HHB-10118-sp]
MGPDWERGLLQPSFAMVKQEQLNTNNDSFPPGRDTITPERWSTVTEEEEKKPVFDHSIGMPRSGTTTSSLNTPRPPSTAQWASLQPSYGSIPGNAYVEDSSGHDSVQRSGSTPAGSAAATSSSSSTSYLPSKSYQHSASTAAHRHVPEPSLPPALKAFFATLRVPSEHLAPIFIRQRMTTDDALDLLCEAPPRELEGIKTEILEEGRLAGWLAVQKGLEERARSRAMRWVEV